ncbi:MAG: CcdB family protein [Candidatus Binatia bacterium]
MGQFAVHRNPNPATQSEFPLLLDVQNDLLSDLGTRVVVPLCAPTLVGGKAITSLTPELRVQGRRYLMITPQLAGVSRKALGEQVADLSAHRDAIVGALDFLVNGF